MVIGYISSLSILLPLIAGLIYFKKVDFNQKCFFFYIVFSTFIEAYSSYLNHQGIDNTGVFKVFLTCEFFFFMWFFNQGSKMPAWMLVASLLVFLLIVFLELYFRFIYVSNTFNYSFIVFFIYFIFQSAFMIIRTFEANAIKFNENYFFWIAFGRLFYFLIILFIFIYPTFVEGYNNQLLFQMAFAAINTIGNIIMNFLYSISFICRKSRI